MQQLLSNTEQRRCRLQCLSDASLHFGWIEHFADGIITVDVNSKRAITKGEFMYLEVSAPTALVTFIAYVTDSVGGTITLQVSSDVEERVLKSESRMKIRSFTGEIGSPSNDNFTSVTIVDISENGFGFIAQNAVQVTGPCQVTLRSAHGEIKLLGDVKHARSEKDFSACRGGVQIKDMDRVSRARWGRLIGG